MNFKALIIVATICKGLVIVAGQDVFNSTVCLSQSNLCKCSKSDYVFVRCELKQADQEPFMPGIDELSSWPDRYLLTIRNKNYPIIDRIVSLDKNLTIFKLNLEKNRINSLGDQIFDNIYELTELRLSENNLTCLRFLASRMVSQVTFIDLGENSIHWLNSEWLINLKELKVLKLNNNRLSNLASETFVSLSKMEILSLYRNEITTIPRYLFKNLTKLEYLNLNENMVSTIEYMGFADCVSLKMDYEELDPTFVFSIASQSVESLDSYTFVDLKNVSYMYLHNNNLNYIKNMTFNGMEQLKGLRLDDNYISSIDPDAFDLSLSRNMQELNMRDNSLAKVNKSTFANLNSLVNLYLGKNYISKIESFSFENQASTLKTLDLSSNRLGDIREHHFSYLTALIKLNLSNNQISTIDNNTFRMTRNLQDLDLAHNCIFKIHSDLFEGLVSLSFLSLSDNMFHDLNANTFNSQTNLVTLDLSYNSLREIPSNLFANLKKLKILKLNNNQLSILDNSISFEGLSALTTLILSNNLIKMLTPNSFKGIGLRTLKSLYLDNNIVDSLNSTKIPFASLSLLDLSSNPYIVNWNIIPTSFANNVEFIFKNMSIQFIKSFWANTKPSTKIKKLDLSQNNQRDLDIDINFMTFPSLATLILSGSMLNLSTYFISGGPYLTELDLSDNPDLQYAPGFQTKSTDLIKLVLSNTGLETVHVLNLENFFNLNYLDLSRNKLKIISSTYFHKLAVLKFLNLSSNSIEMIEPNFLQSFYSVALDLSHNRLGYFQRELIRYDMRDMSALLYLSNNQISSFGQNSSCIDKLDLSQNQLKEIPDDIKRFVFKQSQDLALKFLNLSLNKLSFLKNDSFIDKKYLESIYLTSNQIAVIEDYTFSRLVKLKILDLRNNSISEVNCRTFTGLVRLEYLDLSLNLIEYLSEKTFDSIKALSTLNLNFNKIRQIPDAYLFKPLSYLKRLSLNQIQMEFISNATFEGLESIEEIEMSQSLFSNSINVKALIESLKPIEGHYWYKAISIVYKEKPDYSDRYCSLMIYFARFNLLFNMDIDNFMAYCRIKQIQKLDYRQVGLL